MSYIVQTDQSSSMLAGLTGIEYDYPEGLDFKPGSDLHKKIRDEVFKRATESAAVVSTRFTSWNEIDRTLTTYIDLDDDEWKVKTLDSRKPVSIVFPYSYAILETLMSYLMAAFFQDPIFMYEGVSPEDIIGAIMLEKTVQLHCNKSKIALNLHTMFRDSLSYGFGCTIPYWRKHSGVRTIKQETGFISAISNIFKRTGYERGSEEVVLFEGNALMNVDPYLALPDPNVSIHGVQDGEFFGWVEKTNYLSLLSAEKEDGSDYFNVKYLNEFKGNRATSIYGEDKSSRDKKKGTSKSSVYGSSVRGSNSTRPVDIIHMYVTLIPKEFKLGDSEYPEKWLFSLAADQVVIRAKPLNLNHNLYPVAISAPDFDGYSSTPISRLEVLYGLQKTLDWLFNAHIANVRKAVNDMIVYDPYLVNSKDLTTPGPGKLIRMRRPAWGKGVKDAVMQLSINDVTRQHIGDSSFIVNWMNKIGGADESSVMGSMRQGGPERLSAREFQGTQKAAMSRLERVAKVIGLQAMQDIGVMFASHTQQLMSEELYVKTTGRWQEVLMKEYGINKMTKDKGRMKITPFDVLVDYDIMVRDGSVPGSNFSEVWVRMFETIAKVPELMQEFDLFRIFAHIARNNGAKNVEEFKRIKVMPDQQVMDQAKAGNVIPMEEYGQAAG